MTANKIKEIISDYIWEFENGYINAYELVQKLKTLK